jgi:hypothetical protein
MSLDNKKLIIGYTDGNLQINNKRPNTSFQPLGIPIITRNREIANEEYLNNMNLLTNSTNIHKFNKKGGKPNTNNINIDNILHNLNENDIYKDPLEMMKIQNLQQSIINKNRYYKGAGVNADILTENIIETERHTKLKSYEIYLKKFQYNVALDQALLSKNPLVMMMILEELCRRNGLVTALSGRDEVTLEPILSFLTRYISQPRYAKLLIHVVNTLLDIYSTIIGYSETIDELFLKLKQHIQTEVIALLSIFPLYISLLYIR